MIKTPHIFSSKRQAIEDAKKTVLMVVIIAAIIVSLALVTTNFLWDLSRYKSRVIGEKEAAVENINANRTTVSALVDSFRAFEEGPDLIGTQGEKNNSSIVLDSLPSKYDYPALATSVEGLVKKSGLRLETFSGIDESAAAIEAESEPIEQEISFGLTLVGPYEDTQKFIARLQRTIRPLIIDRIELSGSDKNIRTELDIRTFYQPSVSLEVETQVIQ